MNLEGRNLQLNLRGDDVRRLQTELRQLNFSVNITGIFDTFTFVAVEQFQRAHALRPTGIVDEETARLINAAVDALNSRSLVVRGQVRQTDGIRTIAFANVTVRAFDWDQNDEDLLGETITNSEGKYQITFKPEQFRTPNARDSLNLIVRVYNNREQLLKESPRKDNAQAVETVDLEIETSEPIQEDIFVVQGTIFQENALTLSDVRVVAVDKFVGGEATLGETVTTAKGTYEIRYTLASLKQRGKAVPDIQIKVTQQDENNTLLATSEILYNAGKKETINVIVPEENLEKPDEYRRIRDELTVFINGQTTPRRFAQLQEDDDRQDITYLANKTGWDARMVAMVALADQFSEQNGIQSDLYYALFRAGLPANETLLTQTRPEMIEALWNRAIDNKIIPESLREQIPQNLERLKTQGATQLLNQPAQVGLSSFGELLNISLRDDNDRKQRFARLYYEKRSNLTELWDTVGDEFGEEVRDRLQLDGKLGFLTINNGQLIERLHQTTNLRSPLDLVRQGLYKKETWNELLTDDVAISQNIPGESGETKKANYVDFMVNQLKLSYPTAVVAEMVNNDELSLTGDREIKATTYQFLIEQQGQFEIGIHPVEQYLQKNNLTLAEESLNQVKQVQRVYQISPSDEVMSKLLIHNLDSAYAVTRYDEQQFLDQFQDELGGETITRLTYAKALQVHHTVLNIATAYLSYQISPQLYALPDATSKRLTPTNADVIAYPTLEELFGEMDYCACEHCRSVLSPAAYLVDLLQFSDRNVNEEIITNERENPIDVLLERRPDLQHLQLTCENTNTVLPYIDLVNEILEYFVVNNSSLQGFRGHNIPEGIQTEELLANPQFVNEAAYQRLNQEVFPLILPFHQPLEALRQYFNYFKVPLHVAMEHLRRDDALDVADDAGETEYAWKDILIEQLHLSRQEYPILTNSSIPLQSLYGEAPTLPLATLISGLLEDEVLGRPVGISNVKIFSRKVGISYEELVDIVKTQFINPHSHLIPKLERLEVSFATIQAFLENTDIETAENELNALLPEDITQYLNQYGGNVAQWLRDNSTQIMGLIVLADPTNSGDECNFQQLEFRYALPDLDPDLDPDSDTNQLRAVEFLKLIRFLRLWKKLGWSITETDKAIAALYPLEQQPAPEDNEDTIREKLDQGFEVLILRLAYLQRVIEKLELNPSRDLVKLLSYWSVIDTHGSNSLYHQMFLNPTILRLDDVFEEDGFGNYPKDSDEAIADHQEALQAAFNLNQDELNLILKELGLDNQSNLTLDHMSQIFRYGDLAKKLKLSVWELLTLKTLSGIDPFLPLEPTQPAILQFIDLAQLIKRSSFKISQIIYFLQHEDISGQASPPPASVHALAKTIRDDLKRIDQEHKVEGDTTGEVTRAKMALVYENSVTDTFFGLLNNTSVYSVSYDHNQPALEDSILGVTNRLAYDDFQKQLSFQGVMTEAMRSALEALPDISDIFRAAIQNLFDRAQQEFQLFFDKFPDLKSLYENYAASTQPIEQKLTDLLENFLPDLRQKLKQIQVKQTASAQLGANLAMINLLLETPELLHAVSTLDQPTIQDFLNIEVQGVSVQYFFANDTTGTPDREDVAIAGINYYTAGLTLPQNPNSPDTAISGIWRSHLEVPTNGFYNLYIETDAAAEVTLLLNSRVVAMNLENEIWQNQEAIELKVGQLYSLELTVRNVREKLIVKWESKGVARESIPTAYLFPTILLERFSHTYLRLLKVFAIFEELQFNDTEVRYFGMHSDYRVNGEGWLNALPVNRGSDVTASTALLAAFVALLQYAELKQELKVEGDRLIQVFNNPNSTTETGISFLNQVTGWSDTALTALLNRFNWTEANLANLTSFIRVKNAFDILKKLGIEATSLLASTTNQPAAKTVQTLQSALRAQYDENAWFKVIQPINNELRNHQRDALVAFVLHQFQLQQTEEARAINTPDKLFEYFLIDVQMDSCMQTSRINQANLTVQLFIQRCLLNLEKRVSPSSINAKQWEWMKRYRFWEVVRKLFLFPENWLEPELRDNKSPFFKDLESELLQSDITEDSAATALVHYLEKLDEVAKLEICGMYHEENGANNDADNITHVIGRTVSRQYYYRRQEYGSWTPWEKVDVDIEDNPVLPVVWKGRLFLFWLSVMEEAPTNQNVLTSQPDDEITEVKSSDLRGSNVKVTVKITLYWSEYCNGKWQSPKTSDINRPLILLNKYSSGFVRRAYFSLSSSIRNSGELFINITHPTQSDPTYFKFYNTHSPPIQEYDELFQPPTLSSDTPDGAEPLTGFLVLRSRSFSTSNAISALTIDYFDLFEEDTDERSFNHILLRKATRYKIVDPKHFVQDIFGAPFFLEDSRHLFFVQPVESKVNAGTLQDFGFQLSPPGFETVIPAILFQSDPTDFTLYEPVFFPPDKIRSGILDPSSVESFLDQNRLVKQAIASSGTVVYGNKRIGPGGSLKLTDLNRRNG